MTDDTRPMPEPPGPTDPPTPIRRSSAPLSRLLIALGVLLLLAVGVAAVILPQEDGDDAPGALTDTTAAAGDERPDTTTASDTTSADATGDATSLALVEQPDGTVTLQGAVPSDAVVEQLVTRAEQSYGAGSVTNEMTVTGSGDEPGWLRDVSRLFDVLERVEGAVVDVGFTTAGTLILGGTVATETDREAVLRRFGDALPGFTVDDQLVVGSADAGLDQEQQAVRAELLAAAATITDANVLFATGSAEISDEGAVFLDEIAGILASYPTVDIEIAGHTDSEGSEELNLELSQARADSVLAYLVAAGIEGARLVAVGYGESRPVADNDTDEGRAQNRRIEFTVTDHR